MANAHIARRLREILSYYSGTPEELLGDHSTSLNTGGWDSYANLSVMAAVEEEFGLTVSTRDAMRLESLGDIVAYVEEHATLGRTA